MSTKYFCDHCGNEMPEDEHGRLYVERGNLTVEVHRAVDGAWNGGHVCHRCIRDVVAQGKRAHTAGMRQEKS